MEKIFLSLLSFPTYGIIISPCATKYCHLLQRPQASTHDSLMARKPSFQKNEAKDESVRPGKKFTYAAGSPVEKGYMRWWHSFTGTQPETGETRTFYIEFYIINPALGGTRPILGQHPYFKKRGAKPSYVMVKAGVFPDQEGNGGRQLHAFYPISALQATGSPLIMQLEDANAGKCFYSEDKLTGYVEASPRKPVAAPI